MTTEEELSDEELERLLDEVLGPRRRPPSLPTERPLDSVFASRSHVRVLRVLAALDEHINLTARDVARRGGVAPARAAVVLRELTSTGVVRAYRTPTHAIYRIDDRSPIHDAVRDIFRWERDDATRDGSPRMG